MKKRKIESPVSADVLIYNHRKEPSEETMKRIMDHIDKHKEETMALTEDSLPTPDQQMLMKGALIDSKHDSDDGSTGETAKGS